jgi:hypothetical protein
MDDRQGYCSSLEEQLEILEARIEGIRAKVENATAEGKAAMTQLLQRWPEESLKARRRLAEVKQEGGEWARRKESTDLMWGNLRSIVEDANTAF